MSRKALAFVVGALVVAALVFMVSGLISKPILPEVNQSNVEQEIVKSDRPVVVLVTSRGCSTCKELAEALKAQSEKNPGIKFVQIQAAAIGAPDEALPAVLVFLPGVPMPVYEKPQFKTGNLDAFVAKVGDVDKLRQELDTANKPFDDQLADVQKRAETALAPIQAELEAALKPFRDQAKEIQERQKTALGDLPEQLQNAKTPEEWIKIQTQIAEKAAPFRAELSALQQKAGEATKEIRERGAAVAKPFQEEAEAIEANREKALGDLPQRIQKAVGELEQL